jgi:hypothetical protein
MTAIAVAGPAVMEQFPAAADPPDKKTADDQENDLLPAPRLARSIV